MSDAIEQLYFSAMSISRALKQCENVEILKSYKQEQYRIISSDYYEKDLYSKAEKYLSTPIIKKKYVLKQALKEKMKLSSYSAFAENSMLLEPGNSTFSIGRNSINKYNEDIFKEGILLE